MKRETWVLILFVVIVYLFVFIFPNRNGKIKINKLSPLTEEVKEFSFKVKDIGGKFLFKKIDENWYVSEKKYDADAQWVKDFLDIMVGTIKLEKVSFSHAYAQYDLDDKNRVTVSLMNEKGEDLRTIHIGKSSNRYLSRYVLLEGDDVVYASRTSLGDFFNIDSIDRFRDKSISNFNPSEIVWISSVSGGKKYLVTELSLKKVETVDLEKMKKKQKDYLSENNDQFVDQNSSLYHYKKVYSLINQLSTLKANSFFEIEKNPHLLKNQLISYRYKLSDKEETLTLYKKTDLGYPLTTSFNKQGYFISNNFGQQLEKGFNQYKIK